MAVIEKREGAESASYRVKLRLRGYPAASATFDRLTDAKRWAAETETAIREGRYFQTVAAKRITLAELIDRYLSEYLPSSGIRTKHNTRMALNFWRDELGAHVLADIDAGRIVATRRRLLERSGKGGRKLAPASANKYMAALRHVFNIGRRAFAMRVENPCRDIPKLTEPRGRVRFLSDDERTALLRECKAHSAALHTLVVCALATGARKGELLNLRWPDVDMQRGLMTFHQTKNGERRTVPVVGFARDLLVEQGKVRRLDADLVFFGDTGKPLEIGKMFTEACARARVADFHFHDLRHTAASYIAMNGGTLAEIAEVLGHKTLQMVRRYTHLTEGHTRGVLERMNKAAFGQ
ncbi:tyrosine-type recombinase/integrase [Rudaea sp.]|uniref:tyrosine-type recombinase/integrase n=1 Tax=Rudaea sp. TaxID=2136325 RepID=UPI003785320B